MRNGIHFNKLTLVGSGQEDADDPIAYYYQSGADRPIFTGENSSTQAMFLTFLAISVTCAAATIVSGSYAFWLLRQQAAHQALTNVNDILRSCQNRMSQLESDIQRLPGREA